MAEFMSILTPMPIVSRRGENKMILNQYRHNQEIMSVFIFNDMNRKLIIYFLYIILLSSFTSCGDVFLDHNIYWKNRICGKDLIGNTGLGYPIYNNTVVFHSTPVAGDNDENSIIYGLDTETGKEKWRLPNSDFSPKKKLELGNADYYYQYNNILIVCDFLISDNRKEHYAYAIDIDKGKVLWVKELPFFDEMGRLVRGSGKYAYVDATDRNERFVLYKIDVETGEYTIELDFSKTDLSPSLTKINATLDLFTFSDVYKNTVGEDNIAISINCGAKTNSSRFYMELFIYNLATHKKVYSTPVACSDTLKDSFYGRLCYHDGKIIVGKGAEFLCYDAFQNKGVLWQHNTGSFGNDNAMQVYCLDNLALGFTVDRLFAFDINTGSKLYDVRAAGSNTANIIDGILYQRDGSDLQMRDPKTGKELKRVATPRDAQAFSSSRPNGKDGRIYVHSYTDAYCIKAWGK